MLSQVDRTLRRHGIKLRKQALRNFVALRSVRAWQREAARMLIAAKGHANVERLRTLCKHLKCYDSSHFRSYMKGFGEERFFGEVIAWYVP